MNKAELVATLAEKVGSNKAAEKFINAFVETVTDALLKGDKVQLIGFGTFETRERAAKIGRNPQTGEQIHIDACVVPAFKAGKSLKDALK